MESIQKGIFYSFFLFDHIRCALWIGLVELSLVALFINIVQCWLSFTKSIPTRSYKQFLKSNKKWKKSQQKQIPLAGIQPCTTWGEHNVHNICIAWNCTGFFVVKQPWACDLMIIMLTSYVQAICLLGETVTKKWEKK
jgi:hypothetical protein